MKLKLKVKGSPADVKKALGKFNISTKGIDDKKKVKVKDGKVETKPA